MFRGGLLALAALGAVCLAACSREGVVHRQQAFVFGTSVEVQIAGGDQALATRALGEVLREFDRLHVKLHAWKPGELTRLNEAFARGDPAPVDEELAAVLRDVTAWSERSGGLFNPAIGRLIALWGFQADDFKPMLPDPAAVAEAVRAGPRMADIVIEGNRVRSSNRAVQIDLGGYAKGYALDLAARKLRTLGVRDALVNIGGNVMALGSKGDRPWRIGIQHPRKPAALAVLELRDGEAIGTSGDYQRYFELNGRRYCHLIDPRSGEPAGSAQASSVLVGPGRDAGVLSDVASKPLFIAGPEGWREAARRMGVARALLVGADGTVHVTRALAARLEWVDRDLRIVETD